MYSSKSALQTFFNANKVIYRFKFHTINFYDTIDTPRLHLIPFHLFVSISKVMETLF